MLDTGKAYITNDGEMHFFPTYDHLKDFLTDKLGRDFASIVDVPDVDYESLYEDLCRVQDLIDKNDMEHMSILFKYKLAKEFLGVIQPMINLLEEILE